MSSFNTILLSLLGGVLPALLWLWFWLKEDRLHPEPKTRLALVFFVGMASVLLVLPIEKFIFSMVLSKISLTTLFMWAATEEIIKYLGAYFAALRARENDEPIDAIIYMITVALGFSALENTLFLLNVINDGALAQSIITGNSRFLGATLLHVASSAVIGVIMGLSFYKKAGFKKLTLLVGIITSILLHTIFNLLIIESGKNLFFVFAGVWVFVILLIVLFEKVKKIRS